MSADFRNECDNEQPAEDIEVPLKFAAKCRGLLLENCTVRCGSGKAGERERWFWRRESSVQLFLAKCEARGRAKVTAYFAHSNVMKVEFDAEILPSSGQSMTWQVRFFL